MDIYVLDKTTFEKIEVIDVFKSFIWTERANTAGDFELVLYPNKKWAKVLKVDNYIQHSETDEAMIIEEIHTSRNEDSELITLKGRDLSTLLMRRVVYPPKGVETYKVTSQIPGICQNIVRKFVKEGVNLSGGKDSIPNLTMATNITNTRDYEMAFQPQSVYDAVKTTCDLEDVAFGIALNKKDPRLRFYSYKGGAKDLYFSVETESMTDVSTVQSHKDMYNVAYIWSREGRYRESIESNSFKDGISRRILPIYASDLDIDENTNEARLRRLLRTRGYEALSKSRTTFMIDGTISNVSEYKYRTHYSLGDWITLLDNTGKRRNVMVTEYIYSIDATGMRSYPTFVDKLSSNTWT